MVLVCDAIMGTGKSTAAINYMLTNPQKKFIYVTPILTEIQRVREQCAAIDMHEPEVRYPYTTKYASLEALVEKGVNIACTHTLFKRTGDRLIELIGQRHYTLIIDEALDIFSDNMLCKSDIVFMRKFGILKENDVGLYFDSDVAAWPRYRIEYEMNRRNSLVILDHKGASLGWMMDKALMDACDEVFILTYMFDGQMMKYYCDLYGVNYQYIGIEKKGDYFLFSDHNQYVPDYVYHLKETLHIHEREKDNVIGDPVNAFSRHWLYQHCGQGGDLQREVKNLLRRFFDLKIREGCGTPDTRLWTTIKSRQTQLSHGNKQCFLDLSSKGTNLYADRNLLAYLYNVYMNPMLRKFLVQNGAEVDDMRYALSMAVQWIWRSAIRNGKEVWLYVPSARMRSFLTNWIDDVQNNYCLEARH